MVKKVQVVREILVVDVRIFIFTQKIVISYFISTLIIFGHTHGTDIYSFLIVLSFNQLHTNCIYKTNVYGLSMS